MPDTPVDAQQPQEAASSPADASPRPVIHAQRCRFCGDFGVYADTRCCDPCERQVLEFVGLIRAARGVEDPQAEALRRERDALLQRLRDQSDAHEAKGAEWVGRALKAEGERDEARERVGVLEGALKRIDAIRTDIIGRQSLNWSAHIYPLVAALADAGFEGAGVEEARAKARDLEALWARNECLEGALKQADSMLARFNTYRDEAPQIAEVRAVLAALAGEGGGDHDGS